MTDPAATARALLQARAERRPAGPLPPELAPRTVADGIAAQVAMARMLGADPPAGFKIAATSRTMQEHLRLPGPIAAFVADPAVHQSPARYAWTSLRQPAVECEIGVRLARDLPAGADPAPAIHTLFAAIELVENRYGEDAADGIEAVGAPTVIADQLFHTAAITAAAYPNWRALDLFNLIGEVTIDGHIRGRGKGKDLLGGPLKAVSWLAASATVAAFGGLRAGQILMLGSVTPPIWLSGPCTAKVRFGALRPAVLHLV